MKALLIPAAALTLAACQPANDADPGETPAEAPPTAGAGELTPPPADPAPPAPPTGAPAFVGTWAANAEWCGNTSGAERPVVLTETEFRGYENTCQITDLQPGYRDWTATFVCQSEGTTTRQPVGIVADETQLRITYTDDGRSVTWGRCPA